MPRLLSINNYHYRRGGAEVVHLESSRLFGDRGWDVSAFCMRHPDNEPSDWERYFVDELEFGDDYGLVERIVRAGRVVYSRQAQQRLSLLLDEARPDVAHLHNVYHHLSPSVIRTLRARGVPVVLTTHDLKIACPAYQMLRDGQPCEACRGGRLHNVLVHRCIKDSPVLSGVVLTEAVVHRTLRTYRCGVDRFVAPSRFYIDKFVEWGFDAHQFVHIPNFVRPERFQPTSEPGRRFVYLGRLAPEKGLATLVSAAAAAAAPLTIAGTGPDEAELRRHAAAVGADVEFVGHLTGDALHDLVRSARAVVLPSEWYENAPVSVLEAYALGRIVIGADIGGISELVRRGETGELFESGSIADLAAALERVMAASDGQLAAMGRAARAWAESDFSDVRFVERTERLYRELGVAC